MVLDEDTNFLVKQFKLLDSIADQDKNYKSKRHRIGNFVILSFFFNKFNPVSIIEV